MSVMSAVDLSSDESLSRGVCEVLLHPGTTVALQQSEQLSQQQQQQQSVAIANTKAA
jgi:hypothetical protein